jgi:hypothetical protein|tara:strand:+ start:300 stop:527 length:228 start_codon:yes stop_codon:yes gene_type:complete
MTFKHFRPVLGVLLLLLFLGGCTDLQYYQKEKLGRRTMQLDDDPLENSLKNKILSARETSGGRPGNAAGGGCGCN